MIGPLATLLIVAWPPGNPSAAPQPGTMGRTQAIVIGLGIIVFVALVVGLANFAGSP